MRVFAVVDGIHLWFSVPFNMLYPVTPTLWGRRYTLPGGGCPSPSARSSRRGRCFKAKAVTVCKHSRCELGSKSRRRPHTTAPSSFASCDMLESDSTCVSQMYTRVLQHVLSTKSSQRAATENDSPSQSGIPPCLCHRRPQHPPGCSPTFARVRSGSARQALLHISHGRVRAADRRALKALKRALQQQVACRSGRLYERLVPVGCRNAQLQCGVCQQRHLLAAPLALLVTRPEHTSAVLSAVWCAVLYNPLGRKSLRAWECSISNCDILDVCGI